MSKLGKRLIESARKTLLLFEREAIWQELMNHCENLSHPLETDYDESCVNAGSQASASSQTSPEPKPSTSRRQRRCS